MWNPFRRHRTDKDVIADVVNQVVDEIFSEKPILGKHLVDNYNLMVGVAYHRINDQLEGGLQRAGAYALARRRIRERLGDGGRNK